MGVREYYKLLYTSDAFMEYRRVGLKNIMLFLVVTIALKVRLCTEATIIAYYTLSILLTHYTNVQFLRKQRVLYFPCFIVSRFRVNVYTYWYFIAVLQERKGNVY